jgi:hypothetical protein
VKVVMSKWRGNDEECPVCRLRYKDLRTGLTYEEIVKSLWSASDDPSTWKYRRRGTILGYWWMQKQSMWKYHLQQCLEMAKWYIQCKIEAIDKLPEEKAELDAILSRYESAKDEDIPF